MVAVQQIARRNRLAIDQLIFPQEHLMRRMRGIGLVLIDEGRDLVHRLAILGQRGPRHHHEVGVRPRDIERIIGLQRDIDRPEAALLNQIKAVVEELAKDRHPRVEGGRQTLIRRHVRHDNRQLRQIARGAGLIGQTSRIQRGQDLPLQRVRTGRIAARNSRLVQVELGLNGGGIAIGIVTARHLEGRDQHRRVVHRLVVDQVRDDPRIGIHHIARLDRPRPQRRIVREALRIVIVRKIGRRQVASLRPKAVVQRDIAGRNTREAKIHRTSGPHDRRAKGHPVIALIHPSRRRRTRKLLRRSPIGALPSRKVVVAPINTTQTPRKLRRRQIRPKDLLTPRIRLSNLDLLKDELKVVHVDRNHGLRLHYELRQSRKRPANRNELHSQEGNTPTNGGGPMIRSSVVQ